MQFTIQVAVSVVTAVIAAGTAGALLRRERSPQTVSLIAFNAAVAVWTGGNALQVASTTLGAKLFWVNVQYVGIALLPLSILGFGLSLTSSSEQLSRRQLGLLAAPLAVLTLLSWTNGYHGLVRPSVGLATVDGVVVLQREFGPVFWLGWAYSTLVNLVGTVLVVRAVAYADQVVERRVLALLLGPLVPWVAQFLYLVGAISIEPEVFFGVTGLAFAYAIATWHSIEPTPARDAVFELLDEGVVVVSGDGRVVDLNGAARELLGLGEEPAVGEPLTAVLADHPDLLAAVRAGEPREDFVVETDRGERRLDLQFTSFEDLVGRPDRIAVFVDVTELREQERALERQNERLDSFASIVSHDLRNPLNVAQGHTQLAREESDSEHLSAVERAHERMALLIDDVLALAREGNSVEDCEPVALDEAAESAWRAVATDDATLRTDGGAVIVADRSRLQQLFENLFRNSIEHGSPGSDGETGPLDVRSVGARASDDAGATVGGVTVTVGPTEAGFYVADDGVGIPEDEREQVFETGYSTGQGGTGLGLSIASEIAEAHGWTIEAGESAEGGARFEISGVERAEE